MFDSHSNAYLDFDNAVDFFVPFVEKAALFPCIEWCWQSGLGIALNSAPFLGNLPIALLLWMIT
jgi:hypothetical protein